MRGNVFLIRVLGIMMSSMDDEFDVLAVEMSGLPETIGVEERTGRLHRPALATAD